MQCYIDIFYLQCEYFLHLTYLVIYLKIHLTQLYFYLSGFFGLKEVASYWESVLEINDWQQRRISKLIVKKLFGNLTNKKIVILGFSFKANTNDTRESPAINICKDLLEEGAFLHIIDPKVNTNQIKADLNSDPLQNINEQNENLPSREGRWCKTDYEKSSFNNADAVVLLTEWEDFKIIKWHEVSMLMRKPSWIFDTRAVVNPNEVRDSGINLWRIGEGINKKSYEGW